MSIDPTDILSPVLVEQRIREILKHDGACPTCGGALNKERKVMLEAEVARLGREGNEAHADFLREKETEKKHREKAAEARRRGDRDFVDNFREKSDDEKAALAHRNAMGMVNKAFRAGTANYLGRISPEEFNHFVATNYMSPGDRMTRHC